VGRAADKLPDRLTDSEYRNLMTSLSEPGGAFQFENLLSNEADFPHVMAELVRTAPAGGAYLGVGPEQNFNYIAAIRPKIAFIIDIRHQNVLQHLMYKALFELSADRATFVSRLFSRPRPTELKGDATAAQIFAAFQDATADEALFQSNLREIDAFIAKRGFVLPAEDRRSIERVYAAFRDFGPLMNYNSRGGIPGGRGGGTPSYARLMTETDDADREWSYLATEASYRVVRDLEQRNLIVPLTGDFGGPRTIRGVGQYLKDHGAAVSVFYLSNVEGYLFQGGDRQGNPNGGAAAFYENAASLPLLPSSAFVRWIPTFGGFGGNGTSVRMAPIRSAIEDFNAGRLTVADFFPGRSRGFGRNAGAGIGGLGNFSNRGARAGRLVGPAFSAPDPSWTGVLSRVTLAIIAFCGSFFLRDPFLPRRPHGAPSAERTTRFLGAGRRHRLAIPLSRPATFCLSREKPSDRFFKSMGLGREFQTGDETFDSRIYIESEQGAVQIALKSSAGLRRRILDVFAAGATKLWADGRFLYLDSRDAQREKGLEHVREEVAECWPTALAGMTDVYFSRPRIVRSILWAIAGYAFLSLIGAFFFRETLHLDQPRLFKAGAVAAALTIAGLVGLTLALLQQSSWTHRAVARTALAALFVAPVFGLQLVSDMNRALDRRPFTISATVSRRWETAGRAYFIEVSPAINSGIFPGAIRVSHDVFRSVDSGMTVPVIIGGGRLGIPWLRSINGVLVE
jgi:hypothetical protein